MNELNTKHIKQKKIGRNEPCFCGSGKKFKRCCLYKNTPIFKTQLQKESAPKTLNYVITYAQVITEYFDFIDKNDLDKLNDINGKMIEEQTDYYKYISALEELKKKYPQVSKIYNLLAACYQDANEYEKAESLVFEQYEKFPDYLFAKINIAEYHLKEGKLEEVERIFDGKFNLKQLYPERDVFHVSEATAFISLCGRYFLRKGNIMKANLYLDMLYEFQDPNHPAIQILSSQIQSCTSKILDYVLNKVEIPLNSNL